MDDYLDEVCRFAARLRGTDLPQEVIVNARHVVADTLAVIAAGAQEPEMQKLSGRLAPRSASGACTLLGEARRTDLPIAAFLNGTAGTFLELDEGNQFGRGHPAIHVLPAALAVAEAEEHSGMELLEALVVGYEIGTRIGIAAKLRMSMHPHGTWGTVGAALAVGKLRGYDAEGFRRLINVSSSLGLATSRRTMLEGATVRNVYSGVSNQLGVLAEQLVASGFTGEADGLASVYGAVVSETFDPGAMTDALGRRFEIARNYFKRHACCRYNHAALDALMQICEQAPGGRIDPDQVVSVEVHTYSLAAQLSDPCPQNSLAAKFSIPFAIATALVTGETGVAAFGAQAVRDPRTRALAAKVRVFEDPELTAMMPVYRPARLRVELAGGNVLEAETRVNRGDFEAPYEVDDLRAKFFELARPVWGDAAADEVYACAQELERLANVRRLTDPILSR
ncbi:MAG: MmgE/PrpD family protein [Desulfomicrobiaceae bacterium]|nr:MmgE/PrpD family protein [Desulfomicrobiaceae bacterium]